MIQKEHEILARLINSMCIYVYTMLNKEMKIDWGVLELERILSVFVFVTHCIRSCHVLSTGDVCAGSSFQDILACLLAS